MNTAEKHFALREGHHNAAAEAYFDARPEQDLPLGRKTFEAGFVRAFDLLTAPRRGEVRRLSEHEWKLIASLCSLQGVADALIDRAQATPYEHLDGYMRRWWLFNRFDLGDGPAFPELPTLRVHHILRRDLDRHPHNHPWDARTIILKGWYREERDDGEHLREAGDTAEISASTFHRIVEVSEGGVWTLFVTGPKLQSWGFRTEDGVVPWRTYLGVA